MSENEVRHYVVPCQPECALVVRPSERLREVLREEKYEECDESAFETHRRVYRVGDK